MIGQKETPMVVMLVLLLILTSFVTGEHMAYAAGPAPQYGGTLRITDQDEGPSMGYPGKMTKSYAVRMANPVVESLFRTDKTGKAVPHLASAVKEDAKKATVTMTLRKGIRFHDGTDFDAEAVKWNLDQCKDNRQMGTEKFKSVDVVDANTVRINLTEWDNTTTSSLTYIIGLMVSPTACKKNGEEWCAKNPVGTGPFQFVSWEKDVRSVYKKFPGYWQKGKPYLDGIIRTPIGDAMTRTMALRKGEMDVMLITSGREFENLEKEGFDVRRQKVGSGTISITFDSAEPKSPFADVRVRQAAQYAINGAEMAKGLYYGEAGPANQWIYKGHWAFNPSIKGYSYDPAKARKLLAEAGYPNGFKTRLMHLTSPDNDKLYTAVQGYLQAVGIEAQLDPVNPGRLDQFGFQGSKWDGIIEFAPTSGTVDLAGAMAERYNKTSKRYAWALRPDDFLQAIQKAITATDFKSKQKWTQEALKLMSDKYCLQTFIVERGQFAVSNKKVHDHGFLTTPNSVQWTPELIWMEK
jgi:peptide/nickel transport system substrate-binding protein